MLAIIVKCLIQYIQYKMFYSFMTFYFTKYVDELQLHHLDVKWHEKQKVIAPGTVLRVFVYMIVLNLTTINRIL